jgi:hypothetical protein
MYAYKSVTFNIYTYFLKQWSPYRTFYGYSDWNILAVHTNFTSSNSPGNKQRGKITYNPKLKLYKNV